MVYQIKPRPPVAPPQAVLPPLPSIFNGGAGSQHVNTWYNVGLPTEKQEDGDLEEVLEPAMIFYDDDSSRDIIFTLKASGLYYNKEQFPNHTYKEAAKRLAACINGSYGGTLNIVMFEYKDHETKHFKLTPDGVDHNYEIDTWHWWMLETFSQLMKKI